MGPEGIRREDLGEILVGVVQRNGAKWFRFVLRLLGNEADAEDVLQEAVRRVLLRNRVLPTEDHVKKYLGRAITNTAIELYYSKKKDRTRRVAFQENLGLYPSTPQTVLEEGETYAEKEVMLQALSEALNQLPPKQYEAVRMTILESGATSIRDAGAMSGIAYSTLRHRSVQGLLRLRKLIQHSMRTANVKVGARGRTAARCSISSTSRAQTCPERIRLNAG